MKRVGYIFEKICSTETLELAFKNAIRGKTKRYYIKRLIVHKDEIIKQIQDDLLNDRFIPSEPKRRQIIEPSNGKIREIAMPKFMPDYIIQWAVCLTLKDIFMKGMYHFNVGCIPNRGCQMGINYIKKMYKEHKIKYILKLDIKKYFQNVSHEKLKELLSKKIKDKRALKLIFSIIDYGGQGLPIGFYSSQWLSNFYLQEVDHFIKENLKVKYYVRNVDDMVLADTNKRRLHKARKELSNYLKENGYEIKIKENWQLWRAYERPLDFLGIVFYNENKRLMRKRNFYRFTRRVKRVESLGYCTEKTARQIVSGLGQLKNTTNSMSFYLNHIRPIISKNKISKIISTADKSRKEAIL